MQQHQTRQEDHSSDASVPDLRAPGNPDTGSSSLFQKRKKLLDFAAIRERISIAQVLDTIHWTSVAGRGRQVRGPCPIHRSKNERSTSFSVNTQKNVFRCFGCGAQGNQLDLYSQVTGLPIFESTKDLCERFGVESHLVD